MATKTISWGDGTGQYITCTYASTSGNQTVAISSDANTLATSRQKILTFSATGATSKTVTVNQAGKAGSYSNSFSNSFF